MNVEIFPSFGSREAIFETRTKKYWNKLIFAMREMFKCSKANILSGNHGFIVILMNFQKTWNGYQLTLFVIFKDICLHKKIQ